MNIVLRSPFVTIVLLCFAAAHDALAQIPQQFAVDSISNSITAALPFDRAFVLQVRGDGASSISGGQIVTWKIKRVNGKIEKDIKRDGDKLPIVLLTFDAPDKVFQRKNGVDIYIDPLSPNKNIAIILKHHFDGNLLTELLLINELIRSTGGTPVGDAEIDKHLDDLRSLCNKKIKSTLDFPKAKLNDVTFTMSQWTSDKLVEDGYRTFYKNNLKVSYDKINLAHTVVANSLTEANLSTIAVIADGLKSSSDEMNEVGSIVMNGKIPEMQDGRIPISTSLYSKSADLFRIDLRIENLKSSVNSLQKLQMFLETLKLKSADATIDAVALDVIALLDGTKKYLEILTGEFRTIKDAITAEPNLIYTTWISGNNNILDLKTKGSYQIIPVVGLATFVGIGNEKNQLLARPYIGASIYLRPVDKDVPFKNLSNRFLHQFSFNFGITTGKISSGEFTDYYNSLSIITGINYKIARGIALSGGTIFLQRKNVNPAISETKGTVNPYLGISFDVDLVYTIQKLIDKL